jgi:pSer/pThr/pTyr-binding forkhead associated (FHA) protein
MLIILNGDRAGERFSLEPHQRYVIGRDKETHFCLPEKKVSRQHAILTWNSDSSEVLLEDLNSLNGTIINGKPVTGLNLLRHDDRIQIGSFLLQVDFPQPSLVVEAKQASPKELTSNLEGLPLEAVESELDVEPAADISEDTGGRFLQGKLQEIPFADLLQMLSNMRKSGCLWISDRKLIRPPGLSHITDDVALIVMDAGEVQYAVCGEHENEEAIYSVLRRDHGFFALFPPVVRSFHRV